MLTVVVLEAVTRTYATALDAGSRMTAWQPAVWCLAATSSVGSVAAATRSASCACVANSTQRIRGMLQTCSGGMGAVRRAVVSGCTRAGSPCHPHSSRRSAKGVATLPRSPATR